MRSDVPSRKHQRISPLIIRAYYQYEGDSKEGYLLNLSQGGAFLATNEHLPIEEILHLRIDLPWDLGDVGVEAKVAWRSTMHQPAPEESPEGLGLTFTELTPEASEKVQKFLDKFAQLAAQIDESAQ
jgi:Tfp pilus assembly protein PilZ